ncbi:DUF1707 domain-containing protein [Nocardia sp. NPDC051321]|uniref:DUF1707 domain-containing protein n=1 Tax=Nocardia sp. NPDC051321 TaxID=3364323 RepID=UPI00379F79BE
MEENLTRRIGTSEKDRALTLLNEHHAAGRIDLHEFDLRSRTIANAVTKADLDAVFADLPAAEGARRSRWPLVAAALSVACVALIATVVVLVQHQSPQTRPAEVATTAIARVPSTAPSTSAHTSTTTQSTTAQSNTATPISTITGSGSTADAVQYLMDFKKLSSSSYWSFDTGPGTVSGTPYTRSVMLQPYRRDLAFVEYDLGRKFTRLDGVLGVRDDSTPSDIAMQFQIYADGVLITDTTVKLGATAPIHLEFDKPLRLRLQATDLSGGGDSMGVFGDLRATR